MHIIKRKYLNYIKRKSPKVTLRTKSRPKLDKKKENKTNTVDLGNPRYKVINMQMNKLENMHVILTAEEGMCKIIFLNQFTSQ